MAVSGSSNLLLHLTRAAASVRLVPTQYQDLQDLLDKGWHPVRETGMGGASATGGAAVAFSLILLEKNRPEAAPAAESVPEGLGRQQ